MKSLKILITSGSLNAPLVVMESLAKQGHHIYLLDSDDKCAGFYSRFCRKGILVPQEVDVERYVNAIVDLVKSKKYDLIIPMSDFSTEYLSVHRDRIVPYAKMLLPSKELIQLASHKDQTYLFAQPHGIDIPPTFFPATLSDVEKQAQNLVFPCVTKKPRGTANKGNKYFREGKALLAYYKGLTSKENWPVIQHFVSGDFYGFLGVADRGELLDCIMYQTKQEYTVDGTPPYCWSVTDEGFLKTARRIIKALNWTGAINMDFIRDNKDGKWRLLEINPRLSGTLPFAYQLGVDLPKVYLSLALGEAQKPFAGVRYKAGVRFRFILPDIIFARKNKKQWAKFVVNFANLNIKNDIPWDDPVLIFWKLRHLRWHLQEMHKS